MKLLCVVPSYWPAFQFGGPTFSVHGLNKALVKKGIDVSVYTTNAGLDDKVSINKEVNVDGIKVSYFKFTEILESLGTTGWQFSLPMRRALKDNIKNFDIIYIVAIWNFPTAVASYYCKKYKKPYIISPRGHLYQHSFSAKYWKKMPYYYLIIKWFLKNASAIHYTTEDEAIRCHSMPALKNREIVIPSGVDLSEFEDLPTKESLQEHYQILKGKKIILFLGRIHWKKGLDILVKAYSKLSKERDDVHLLIVGNDEENYGTKVKRWLKKYGLEYDDTSHSSSQYLNISTSISQPSILNPVSYILHRDARVTFTGMLTGSDKLEVFAGSDIFVLPSYSENFGMAVLEAMACGIPVIISDQVGIYKEVSEAKAGIVIKNNADQLAETINNLLDTPIAIREMGKNGRRLVQEKFVWDEVAEQMIEMYERMSSIKMNK